jgi:hypothetical protein
MKTLRHFCNKGKIPVVGKEKIWYNDDNDDKCSFATAGFGAWKL